MKVSSWRMVWLTVSVAILALDIWTKHLAESLLPLRGGSVPIIDGFLSLTLVHNTGAAFGLFSSLEPQRTAFILSLVTTLAAIAVAAYSFLTPADRRLPQAGLALVLGGAFGNLVDRVGSGHVVDFVEVYFRGFHWPNFNVADSAISVGVALLILDTFRAPAPEPSCSRAS